MIQLFGKEYYIDIDGTVDKCRIDNNINHFKKNDDDEQIEETEQSINVFKYEIIKMCIDRVLSEMQYVDENMGPFSSNETSSSFKIAFNTLIKNQILIEDEQ